MFMINGEFHLFEVEFTIAKLLYMLLLKEF